MKKVFILMMALAIGLTGSMTPFATDSTAGCWGIAKAEAKGSNAADREFQKRIEKIIQIAAQSALKRTLRSSLSNMKDHRASMLSNLNKAAGHYLAADYQIDLAAGLCGEHGTDYTQKKLVANELIAGRGNLSDFKKITVTQKRDNQQLEATLNNLSESNDKELQAKVNECVRQSKSHNAHAAVYVGLALKDGAFIAGEALNNLGKVKDFASLKRQFDTYSSLVRDTEQVCTFINNAIKERNKATQSYCEKNNIKEPNKKDVEKAVAEMKPQ